MCTQCIFPYNLVNGRCEKDIQNETETIICEKGYFLPIDNEGDQNCLKCNIEKCIECYGSKDLIICTQCIFPYNLVNGRCEKDIFQILAKYKTISDNQKTILIGNRGNYLVKEIKINNEIINYSI